MPRGVSRERGPYRTHRCKRYEESAGVSCRRNCRGSQVQIKMSLHRRRAGAFALEKVVVQVQADSAEER